MANESINETIQKRWETFAPSPAKTRVLGWVKYAHTTGAKAGTLNNALELRNYLLGGLWCAELALTSQAISESMRQLLDATRRDLDARLYALAEELEREAEGQNRASV